MKRTLVAAALLLLASTAAMAETCTVNDPTGTPLNVRARPDNGPILGALNNGTLVIVQETREKWVRIVPTIEGAKDGWVFREYLNCKKGGDKLSLPPDMLGTWCVFAEQRGIVTYERRQSCQRRESDDWLVLAANGNYEAHEMGCKLVKRVEKDRLHYRCTGEGMAWTEDVTMWLTRDGYLAMYRSTSNMRTEGRAR
jgi:uncharacterized protein YraI